MTYVFHPKEIFERLKQIGVRIFFLLYFLYACKILWRIIDKSFYLMCLKRIIENYMLHWTVTLTLALADTHIDLTYIDLIGWLITF